jgi:catechol 2,3-dioxygenase-like lactoylglutathione lyase family enzyme
MSPHKTNTAWLPKRLHHYAWVTGDQQTTRTFYQDVVGLPLLATWTETGPLMGEGEQAYCHTLYGLGDGSSLAFFQFSDDDFARRHAPPPPDCPFRHIALLVDEQTQQAISERAQCAGVEPTFVDHGYCRSLYLTDPNGLRLEFTVDHPQVDTINARRRESAHRDLQRWLEGDCTNNNDWRPI